MQDTHYTFKNTYNNLTVTCNELLAREVEAFDGFLLGLLTHDVLMVAASAAGEVHFNPSLTAVHHCHLCDPCSSLGNQGREQIMLV